MNKRFPLLLTIVLLGFTHIAEAQQPRKVPRVGLLISASTAVTAPSIESFRHGMRDGGYIEGKNYLLEIRGGEAEPERLANLANELVRQKVDIIVAGGNPAVRAA